MHKLLLIIALGAFLLAGCGPKSQPTVDDKTDVTGLHTVNAPDPGRSPDDMAKLGIETPPEPVHQMTPDYPNQARELGITGYVIIQAFIDENGWVKKAQAKSCSRPGFGFEAAALDAAFQCRYKPARQNGLAIGVWITYKVNFSLN